MQISASAIFKKTGKNGSTTPFFASKPSFIVNFCLVVLNFTYLTYYYINAKNLLGLLVVNFNPKMINHTKRFFDRV